MRNKLTAAAAVFAIGTLLASCNKQTSIKVFEVSGVRYVIPKGHIHGILTEGSWAPFALVEPPGTGIVLLHSSRDQVPDITPGEPVIPHINKFPEHGELVQTSSIHKVVCNPRRLRSHCGIRVLDRSVPWFVLFDIDRAAQADAIAKQALDLLLAYRQR